MSTVWNGARVLAWVCIVETPYGPPCLRLIEASRPSPKQLLLERHDACRIMG
jgi:hypothetical protein